MCSFGVSASNGESLVISLNFTLPPVLTFTTATSPVLDTPPQSVRPSNLALVCLAQTLKRHFLRDYLLVETICDGMQFSVGKYSWIKRLHTLRINSSTHLHRLRTAFGFVSTVSGCSLPPIWSIKKWFGLNTGSLLTFPLTVVKGLEFNKLSTHVCPVCNFSSVLTLTWLRAAEIVLLCDFRML